MKMCNLLVSLLVLTGFAQGVFAWTIKVYNKTPFEIMARAKSWGGALNGGWVSIPHGEVGKVGPGGADCIDGMWVKVLYTRKR